MKNKEKFEKEIFDIACNGSSIAVDKNGKVVACRDLPCIKCIFNGGSCSFSDKVRKWAESEYKEPKIHPEVKNCNVDDKILVSADGIHWYNRHIVGYDNERNLVYTWIEGRTSWSAYRKEEWEYAKLPESEVQE